MRGILAGHECTSVPRRGWTGMRNGDLLRLAESEFDLFVTTDQNLRYQQNLADRRIAIIELSTNDVRRILAAAPVILSAIHDSGPGDFLQIAIPARAL